MTSINEKLVPFAMKGNSQYFFKKRKQNNLTKFQLYTLACLCSEPKAYSSLLKRQMNKY